MRTALNQLTRTSFYVCLQPWHNYFKEKRRKPGPPMKAIQAKLLMTKKYFTLHKWFLILIVAFRNLWFFIFICWQKSHWLSRFYAIWCDIHIYNVIDKSTLICFDCVWHYYKVMYLAHVFWLLWLLLSEECTMPCFQPKI